MKVGIICGGFSGESVISMKSARMILENIDRDMYDPRLMRIDENGWVGIGESGEQPIDKNDFSFQDGDQRFKPDICFNMIHGTPGEDGKLQGYFDLIDMPYTSGDVLNSSITFHKITTTRIMRMMGFNVAQGILVNRPDELNISEVTSKLGYPVFVKPNEGGSSLGISKVKQESELEEAVKKAYSVGGAVLIEEYLEGGEFTCGVIQTPEGPRALEITEIRTKKEFFDYAAKYDYDQTQEITPAELPADLYKKCQRISKEIFTAFMCRGFARVDYKLKGNEFYPIEINTVPGMSDKSLVPQQAEAAGISKKDLITMIIEATLPKR